MNWDDLRFFSAVVEAGTLSGAARQLGINHSTVYRRIKALEDSQNVRLFERMDRGYQLTAQGEEMKRVTDNLSVEIDALERKLAGHDLRLSGNVRITTTDTLLNGLLGPHIAAFKSQFPGIELEILLDMQHLNLSKREADIAIRPTDHPPEVLVGRKVSNLSFGIYATDIYMEKRGEVENLSAHSWITMDDSLNHLAAFQWLKENLDAPQISMTSNNFFALMAGALSHMGVAPLPCFMGDVQPTLNRIQTLSVSSSLWVLTHADLQQSARIRAFMDFMYKTLSGEQALLEGRYKRP